jgi:UPF0042 nucleotide-binding protein
VTFTRFVVVTGLSGAGKSQTMKSFEDLGFYCLDNLPPALVADLVRLAERSGIGRVALSLDVRVGGAFGDALGALEELEARAIPFEVLYLDADDETLLRRYSETRRRHPHECRDGLREAIAIERGWLEPFRKRATRIWDTSALTHTALKELVRSTYADDQPARTLSVNVVAFGYKFGLPLDADLVFDVRFFPNPHYVPELQPLNGSDPPVAAFMEALPEMASFLARLFALVDFSIPLYEREGKVRLTIAVGCTGGRHRSVYVANRLAAHLEGLAGLTVSRADRELVAAS